MVDWMDFDPLNGIENLKMGMYNPVLSGGE